MVIDKHTQDRSPEIELRVRALLDDGLPEPDARMCARLARARSAVLRGVHDRPPKWGPPTWVAATALPALAAVAVAFFLVHSGSVRRSSAATLPDTDLFMLMNEEPLDLIEEMEFYAWLDRQTDFNAIQDDESAG